MKINKLIAHSSNFNMGRKQKIQFLVIHYTANNGDLAKSNCNYFKLPNRNSSAHYFVDEKEIWQSVEDNDMAWHCGTRGKYYHSSCRNENAIGIELCSEKDRKGNYYFTNETINNAVSLVKILMEKYNIPIENVVRHYDVTHKNCPAPFVNNITAWDNFKNSLTEEYMFVERNYSYNGKVKSFKVINEQGENFIRARDLADLLNKNISYDNKTKITNLDDIFSNITVEVGNKNTTVKAINSGGFNFVKVRDLADVLGYETGYNETNNSIFFNLKKSIIDKLKLLKSR
ncbi:peptidoglycan recognition family protein [uncultured Tyzzerella sp.]|uniref:peptidoglycan recognition protein family protein n=1 Tax=uncultured Tyzzerella sp. TaxID=2321398 RepID=UPI002941DEB4|nr:peptidoglycan recognition family protein [uncultured Tyzzerella sp.]